METVDFIFDSIRNWSLEKGIWNLKMFKYLTLCCLFKCENKLASLKSTLLMNGWEWSFFGTRSLYLNSHAMCHCVMLPKGHVKPLTFHSFPMSRTIHKSYQWLYWKTQSRYQMSPSTTIPIFDKRQRMKHCENKKKITNNRPECWRGMHLGARFYKHAVTGHIYKTGTGMILIVAQKSKSHMNRKIKIFCLWL